MIIVSSRIQMNPAPVGPILLTGNDLWANNFPCVNSFTDTNSQRAAATSGVHARNTTAEGAIVSHG